MKHVLILIFAFSIILISSCNTSKKAVKNKDNADDICKSMTFTDQPVSNISTDYYTIDSLFIINDCLNIWVSYGGGCGDADFKLYYSERIMTSMPPQTSLLLQLTDDDPCRAIVQQKLFFNISFFSEDAKKDGILLNLAGSDKSVMY